MHNHVANRGRKALLKQIFSVFLIFTLYFNCFNSAYAAGGFAPWSITNTVVQGASTVLTGTKEVILNGAKKIATGTAKITPTAAQVSKVLARGAAGYALSVAVQQLLGAVDWVLDPANNRITYVDPNVKSPADKYCQEQAAIKYGAGSEWAKKAVYAKVGLYAGYCILSDNPNFPLFPAGTQNTTIPEEDRKSIPLDTVAQQVISNAENGDTNAQVATTAAAADIINDAQTDNTKARPIINQLENTQSIPTDQTAKGDAVPKENANTENPSSSVAAPATDLTLDFPIFCDWAPSICQAAKWVITQPQVWADAVTDSWDWTKTKYEAAVTSITDFFKNEPNPDSDNSLPVQDIPLPELNTGTFKATAGCPAPIPINITIGTKGTGSISYEPICQFASKWSFVAPLIGFLSGAMILVGVGRKGEDSEI
ncbi:virulence factor TspB C-terminal domain-related protein [Acinetobacter parvus]|uniref:Uncharacterized protein n=1 Tax=Acinetobacter parvus DSM 16617 = CIP 108168 TaxID=981333 RepID=N8RND5_9GAMM|nr:virulence factor TspB C-terminal domain-related protein [Acinetobacter parvus]ENU35039.1 hypothetical protein F988_02828 [Acinetobacter parvus DSM 16617 = CIP 108168]ENU36439.1 hypothetical protein F988_01306 [Acinetobacter parvus DSM 16617 = CIP 108168]